MSRLGRKLAAKELEKSIRKFEQWQRGEIEMQLPVGTVMHMKQTALENLFITTGPVSDGGFVPCVHVSYTARGLYSVSTSFLVDLNSKEFDYQVIHRPLDYDAISQAQNAAVNECEVAP